MTEVIDYEPQSQAVPYLEYGSDWDVGERPYDVSVNLESSAELLRGLGMSEQQISDTGIVLWRRQSGLKRLFVPSFGRKVHAGGSFNPQDGKVNVFTDWAWRDYQFLSGGVKEGIKKQIDEQETQFKGSPAEDFYRSFMEFHTMLIAQPAVEAAVNERLSGVLLHELKHRRDWNDSGLRLRGRMMRRLVVLGCTAPAYFLVSQVTNGLVIDHEHAVLLKDFIRITGTIAVGFGLSIPAMSLEYKVDPMEKSASRFSDQMMKEEKYKSLVSLTPKDSVSGIVRFMI